MSVIDWQAALKQIRRWQAVGDSIVFSNGCFDLLHAGHIEILTAARNLGDRLVLGLNSDSSVARLKGNLRPIVPEADRAIILTALRMVDLVVIFNEDTPARLIEFLTPDILVKGADYQPEEIAGGTHVLKSGGQIKTIPLVPGYSTSAIITKIRQLNEAEKS